MAYDPKILQRATARLDRRRAAREAELDARRQELYRRFPRLAQIDAELKTTIIGVITAALRRGVDPQPELRRLKAENQGLQQERRDILTANGYPADALESRPYCPKCDDSGWVGVEMCSCLKELCAQEQIKDLSSLLNLGEQSFDHFDLSLYSPQPWEPQGISPRENMKLVYDICRNYADKFGKYYFKNLLLSGTPGLGKTFLSACIARTVSERGYSVVYDTVGNILSRFEEQKFRSDESARDDTRRYLACDLLIVDDLGSELTTPFAQSALYTLVNTRLAADLATVISTNLTKEQLRQRYSPQLASRLEGEYRLLPFFGEDIRLKNRG